MSAFNRKLCLRFALAGALTAIAVTALISLESSVSANAPVTPPAPARLLLPSQLGDFKMIGSTSEIKSANPVEPLLPATPAPKAIAAGSYASSDGVNLRVRLLKWETDAQAYASFTNLRVSRGPDSDSQSEIIGTASTLIDVGIAFFKGTNSVMISAESTEQRQHAVRFATLLAPTLDDGEGEVPVLVKHLPNWEVAQRRAIYAMDSWGLIREFPDQAILKEVSFDGGTEAVIAKYGQSQLAIVEFTTPQFSIDNDSRIWTKIAELKAQGQPTPSAYRRVGNYSVFVFNAADEKSANALIDQVKYEQVVQWLGDDPHLYERLQRYFTQTSAGVLVAVLKSSGLSLLFCLAAGALIGTMMFRRRRAQRAAAFSDAGGSVRLNLDDLTAPVPSTPLLPAGKSARADSAES